MKEKTLYPIKLEQCAKDRYGSPLVCSGCAHSAPSIPFPSGPSGERPCCFCVRNVDLPAMLEGMRRNNVAHFMPDVYGKTWTAFYNNAPMRKCPMDCYISTDMITNDVEPGSIVIT